VKFDDIRHRSYRRCCVSDGGEIINFINNLRQDQGYEGLVAVQGEEIQSVVC
jgi:hypothetical protein